MLLGTYYAMRVCFHCKNDARRGKLPTPPTPFGSNFSPQNGPQNLPQNWGLENANKKETDGIHENVAPNWEPKLTSKRGVDIAACFLAEALAGLVRFAKGPFCGYQHDAWKGVSVVLFATYSEGTGFCVAS